MNRPAILGMDADSLKALRESEAGKVLLEWMEWELESAKERVLDCTLRPDSGNAMLWGGAAASFAKIITGLRYVPVAISETDEENFTDPASRPSQRKVTNAEVR